MNSLALAGDAAPKIGVIRGSTMTESIYFWGNGSGYRPTDYHAGLELVGMRQRELRDLRRHDRQAWQARGAGQ
jgi:hypothetical protein